MYSIRAATAGNTVSVRTPSGPWIGVFAIGFLLFAFLWAGPALAKGPGLRAGDLVLHPSFTVGGGYDSNFWRESRYEASAPVNPVTVIRFGGGLAFGNRSPNKLGLNVKLSAIGRYARSEEPELTASEMDDSVGLDTAKLNVGLSILPKKPVTIDVKGDVRYSERPGVEMLKEDGYQRLIATFGPDLRFRPGSSPDSRALELRLGYRFSIDRNLGGATGLGSIRGDKDTHQLSFLTHWKFFPKTALILDVQYWLINYRVGVDVDLDGQSIDGPNKDLSPLRAEIGIQGLISRRLALTLRGGYSNSYNDEGESYEGAIGRVNIDYTLEPFLQLGLGYSLKLGDDSFSNFYTLHRGFVRGTVNLPARLSLGGRLGLDYYVYSRDGSPAWAVGLPDRTEPIMRALAEIGWNPVNWFTMKASWEFENNRSDFYYCLGDTPGRCFANDPVDLAAYSRHIVMLSIASEY